ncbi:MAG: hypothetical protein C0518_02555 [Opitutus sp.]|nr:hypothetical protein [Opitutus sp.]
MSSSSALAAPPPPRERLEQLRTELVELAFTLERQGRLDAADVALEISGRVGEVAAALAEPALAR